MTILNNTTDLFVPDIPLLTKTIRLHSSIEALAGTLGHAEMGAGYSRSEKIFSSLREAINQVLPGDLGREFSGLFPPEGGSSPEILRLNAVAMKTWLTSVLEEWRSILLSEKELPRESSDGPGLYL